MGETPAKVTAAMAGTRASIEANVASLKASTAARVDDVSQRVALTVDTIGTSAGEAAQAAAGAIPKLANPMPLLIACTLVGFAIGFVAPLTAIERERLAPLGDEIGRQAKAARANLLGAL